ncbi:hypothetical protein CKN86_03530 [Carnobacterium divergens]|uniref:metal-sensitive transcriptional regulator n=1 Tax=Carnobacterium divergens TaxID=2748 RepID=UPI000D6E84A3|nr:metal-sensitive transcriptional regulator [Carnobacterium divergens]MCO6018849.1 metal-sensitive transcriptional regulator [Carnobacterium divergens]TFI63831.1 hypothetical protein CKN62_03565 [Carnobacterium divergens]TFI90994.1 hypothetical protein CKN84_03565 [Carnobacterium divergens]TFJ05861.1 hypothetical protein CKN86_03530 [Carnobacterium divergens]TFJ07509.1 hypothetical protein CKN65_03570 [Carnobacterium divergens]
MSWVACLLGKERLLVECDKKILNRLKRSEGQIRGVLKMIEEERECQDVITQLSAVRSSIDKVMGIMVAENLVQCIEESDNSKEVYEQRVKEAIDLIVKVK